MPTAPAERKAVWTSTAPAVGTWVQLTWQRPTTVDRVRVFGAAGGTALRSALVVFDGGRSVLATAGPGGDVDVTLPASPMSTVRVVIAAVDDAAASSGLALAAVVVDGSAASAPAGPLKSGEAASATVSSGTDPAALQDGDVAAGRAGATWRADETDLHPWAQLAWSEPKMLSAVQVAGPSSASPSGTDPVAAPLHGRLVFDDGSIVIVSGIADETGPPTTVAFAPRAVKSVRIELTATTPGATVELRELRAYGIGSTPPRWPAMGGTYTVSPPSDACSANNSLAAPSATHPVVLVCPAVGSVVAAIATVVVAARPGAHLSVEGAPVDASGIQQPLQQIATTTAEVDGRAIIQLDATMLPNGPFTVLVRDSAAEPEHLPLAVQLLGTLGRQTRAVSTAPAGMTLQWRDDFDEPLSVTIDGDGADYAARKPTRQGGGNFGDTGFGDPGGPTQPLATLDGYLRLRAVQGEAASIISSARVGASGFSAQYGYFEARVLGGPGQGSWPAFWALNAESATSDDATAGEADAVELYGHNTRGSCHTVHSWGTPGTADDEGMPSCLANNGFADWSTTWHTYGMRVGPNGATFSIDGVQVAQRSGLGRSEEPFFFLLDQALGGGWPVDLSPTGGVVDTYVDWVSVYT